MNRVGLVILVYLTLALASGLSTYLLHGDVLLAEDAWLASSPLAAHAYGALLGLTFGLLVARLTPGWVSRSAWAQKLQAELSPLASGLSPGAVLAVAGLSALGEELLFRALLLPLVGLVPQAALFGLAHQLPGRARWIWVEFSPDHLRGAGTDPDAFLDSLGALGMKVFAVTRAGTLEPLTDPRAHVRQLGSGYGDLVLLRDAPPRSTAA